MLEKGVINKMRVTLLGTGLMGSAMARRLCAEGANVTVWNRTAQRAEALREYGITPCRSAVEAVVAAEVVLLTLSNADAIESMLASEGMTEAVRGRLLVQMGTIAPEESRALAAKIKTLGAAFIEAPVLGSIPEALKGTLLIMTGGDEAVVERALPVLEMLGKQPRHIGAVGQASALKLALNQLIASLTAAFSLSLGLVRREGVDVKTFMDVLRKSALYAPTFDKKLAREIEWNFSNPNFPLKHLLKDVDLFRQVAAADGLDDRPLEGIRAAIAAGIAAGFGELDYSVLYAVIDPQSR